MRKQRWIWHLLLGLYICFLFSNSLTPAAQSSEVSGRALQLIHQLLSCPFSSKAPLHILSGFLIPFVDETLQLFTEGRSGQISDVWLDSCGVWAGTMLFLCLFLMWKRWRRSMEQQT